MASRDGGDDISSTGFLISRGARLDVRDKAGRTPLDMAIFTKNQEAAELYRQAAGVTVSGIAR